MMGLEIAWKAYYETLWQFVATMVALTFSCIYISIVIFKSARRFWCQQVKNSKSSTNQRHEIGRAFKWLTMAYLVLFCLYALMSWIFRVLIIVFDIPIICLMSDLVVIWFEISRMALHLMYFTRYDYEQKNNQ